MSVMQQITDLKIEPSFFAMIPKIAEHELEKNERLVYLHFKQITGENPAGYVTESERTSCGIIGISRQTFRTAKEGLVTKGYIVIIEKGSPNMNGVKGTADIIQLTNQWYRNTIAFGRNKEANDLRKLVRSALDHEPHILKRLNLTPSFVEEHCKGVEIDPNGQNLIPKGSNFDPQGSISDPKEKRKTLKKGRTTLHDQERPSWVQAPDSADDAISDAARSREPGPAGNVNPDDSPKALIQVIEERFGCTLNKQQTKKLSSKCDVNFPRNEERMPAPVDLYDHDPQYQTWAGERINYYLIELKEGKEPNEVVNRLVNMLRNLTHPKYGFLESDSISSASYEMPTR